MNLICKTCSLEFPSKRELNKHIKSQHESTKTFSCPTCLNCFKHTSSLRRHIKTCNINDVKPTTLLLRKRPNDNKMNPEYKKPRITVTRCVFAQYQYLRDLLHDTQTFTKWAEQYQTLRGTDDPSLSQSTTANIISTYTNHIEKLELVWGDPMQFCEQVDQWLDTRFEDTTLQPITTVNHLRHLRWWAMYEFTRKQTESFVLDWLTDTITSVQAASSKRSNDLPCIAMLDPYELTRLRDKIVMALQKQQRDVIDPFLMKVCCAPTPATYRAQCVSFGLSHLRCFLDLALRFLCPPQRMQCTIYQCEPDTTDNQYVCKLSRRNNEYIRIIHRDKTGDTHQPLEVPIGGTISVYLTFYRIFCRPDPSRNNTFQTAGGGYWVHASRDVKQYVKEHLLIDPNEIEPNGRFVHGSRHIGLATYALAVQFNSERLREFAHLIRHSVAVSEKYYSVWLERNRNERASKHFCDTMGLESIETPIVTYQPLTLRPPHTLIKSKMVRKFQEELGKTMFTDSPYQLCDASTQTGPDDIPNTPVRHMSDSCTLPLCKVCHESFLVMGPLGQSRHKHFGRYFAQCVKCHGRRPDPSSVVWYPLGYIPSCSSVSQKPRNIKKIESFINTCS